MLHAVIFTQQSIYLQIFILSFDMIIFLCVICYQLLSSGIHGMDSLELEDSRSFKSTPFNCHLFARRLVTHRLFKTQTDALDFYLNYFRKYLNTDLIVAEKLGQGEQGTVYRLSAGDSQFALKFKLNPSSSQKASLQKEHGILVNIRHPNVVQVRGFHQNGAILMDFIPGENFAFYLKKYSETKNQSPLELELMQAFI